MPTQTSNGKSAKPTSQPTTTNSKRSVKSTGTVKSTATGTVKSSGTAKSASAKDSNQLKSVAEAAVDLPVGAVLGVTERISDLVEPWTGRSAAEKQIKAYRVELRRSLKRVERRGATARRKALTQARKTRVRVERDARRRQHTVETTLKRNREGVEQRVRKAIDERSARAQDLVEQLTDQLSALR
jgi:hypothetical protein